MKKISKDLSQRAAYWAGVIIIGVFVGLSMQLAIAAWSEPTATAPNGNIGAPINISSIGQSKAGGLILNTGGATNGLIVQKGNVGIGTTSPTQKLDVNGYVRGGTGLCIGNDCRTSWPSGGGNGTVLGSGTTNYLPKWTANTTLGNSLVTDNGTTVNINGSLSTVGGAILNTGGAANGLIVQKGNMGVGTSAPAQKLDVNGYVKGTTGLCMNTDCRTSWQNAVIGTDVPASTTCPNDQPGAKTVTLSPSDIVIYGGKIAVKYYVVAKYFNDGQHAYTRYYNGSWSNCSSVNITADSGGAGGAD